jgi:probable rRNA maturation factor
MSPNQVRLALSIERLDGTAAVPDDGWFERIAVAVLEPLHLRREVEVSLLLADDEALRRLNRDFRSLDKPTDVLSFPQLEGGASALTHAAAPEDRPLHLGDVAISVERAVRQAGEYGHSVEREMGYLFAHGLLHLIGYDHESDVEQVEMRQAEEAALDAAGLTRLTRG